MITWLRVSLRGLPWMPAGPPSVPATRERSTLTGLKGVAVLVMGGDEADGSHALTRRRLQEDIESRLREAGIRLLEAEEWLQTPGKPTLALTLRVLRHELGIATATAALELTQEVRLEFDPSRRATATTWCTRSGPGVVGVYVLGMLRDEVLALVDRFVADYVSVNRDPPGSPSAQGPTPAR